MTLAAKKPPEVIRGAQRFSYLAATHTVTAVQALVASTAPNSDMTTGVTGRGITLHAAGGGINGIQLGDFGRPGSGGIGVSGRFGYDADIAELGRPVG